MVSYFALSGLSASRASTNSCKERLLFGLGGGNGVMVSWGLFMQEKPTVSDIQHPIWLNCAKEPIIRYSIKGKVARHGSFDHGSCFA
jgi:hypothetical protein